MTICNRSNLYQGYLYSYPHKTAYRGLETPVNLETAWSKENKSALFFYLHIPFCTNKCGFCNLFSISKAENGLISNYLTAIKKQAEATKTFLGAYQCARYAIGGGTPSYLSTSQLADVFDIFHNTLSIKKATPGSIEISPETASEEKLKLFSGNEVQRISMGVQSFNDSELKALSRPQSEQTVLKRLEQIKALAFPVLNIDLIYGIKGQTRESFTKSIRSALRFSPEEIYLYPLYIRPSTKLEGQKRSDNMYSLYQHGRDLLLENGYTQVSMRLFRRLFRRKFHHLNQPFDANVDSDPSYCCQEDGMIGLGTGARSYTTHFHYSTPYAAQREQSIEIIKAFNQKTKKDFLFADFGIHLSIDEKKRRYLIKSILQSKGLDRENYKRFFSTDCSDDFNELAAYEANGLLTISDGNIKMTQKGIAFSDSIGPALMSETIKQRMKDFSS